MKYNKTQKRFDLGLGLNFRIVEDDHYQLLRVKSNIPDLEYLSGHTKILDLLEEINHKLQYSPLYVNTGRTYLEQLIKLNNIKELL